IEKRYCDMYTESLEEALTVANEYKEKKEPISIGLLGNAAEILPELVKRNITPDLVTDQTSAHDPLNGYIPVGYTLEEAAKLREEDPERYVQLSKES
ncbi:urocanate hydratase, partial [Klebsiella pneumoniae]|nr:urocanate hydratase [Klebsiella pneumoniae]